MSKDLLKDTKFKSEIKKFFESHKEIVIDIILFGSALKGKERPRDIDLLILYKNKKDIDISYGLSKQLKKIGYNVEIIGKTYKELLDENFNAREAVLSEGYSIIHGRFLSNALGFINMHLFKYELRGLNKSDRMRFYYSLYGRTKKQKGMLDELNAIKFSDSILLCPVIKSEKMKEYFEQWKIDYKDFPIMIPARVKPILLGNK